MHAVMLGVTWGLLGLDVGWRPLSGGGVEYIIQIAPGELEVFRQNGIEGDVPPQLRDIRAYRVVVGSDVLPRQDPPQQAPAASKPSSQPSWLAALQTPSNETKSSPYNPFPSLRSLLSPYPSGQTAPDSANRFEPKEPSRPKSAGADRWSGQAQAKDERSTSKDTLKETKAAPKETKETPKESSRPWPAFTVVVLVLLGSLGGNVYMGWITWETRARYHALVRRRKKAKHSWRETTYDSDAEAEEE